MLNRTKVRHYIHALLASEVIPPGSLELEEGQEEEFCDLGPLYTNCNGDPMTIQDSFTHQAIDDYAGNLPVNDIENVFLTFSIPKVQYVIETEHNIESSNITLEIRIYVYNSDSRDRQDILDKIEERIYIRLLSHVDVECEGSEEEEEPKVIPSFMKISKNNEAFTIQADDDSDPESDVTIRTLILNFVLSECIRDVSCDESIPVCYKFKQVKEEQLGCEG